MIFKNIKSKYINNTFALSILLAMLPWFVFFFTMFYDGASFKSLMIPFHNNDELIYYYQVDGLINHGGPLGLYGYHEWYSNISSYGAWSPVLMINYLAFGKLFGWTTVRAIIYNVIMLSGSLFIFGMLARPSLNQALWISALYTAYTFTVQGMFSVSPEATCYSYIIIYLGLLYSRMRTGNTYSVTMMFAVAVLLTLMRPYFLAFMLPPGFYLYKNKRKKAVVLTFITSLAAVYLYGFICVNICAGNPTAGVFSKVIKTVKLNTDLSVNGHSPFLTSVLLDGMTTMFVNGLKQNYRQVKWFFTEGNTGRNFINFIVFTIIIAIWALMTVRSEKESKDKKYLAVFFCGYFGVMALAICMMFPGWAASRHLAQFILMAVLFLPMELDRTCLKLIMFITLLYTMTVVPNGHMAYLPNEKIDNIIELGKELKDEMKIEPSGGPTWDNTVLWVYADYSTGETRVTPWQYLFAVPSGFAFNMENMEGTPWLGYKHISSRYAATVRGGRSEEICLEQGLVKIAELDELIIFKNY